MRVEVEKEGRINLFSVGGRGGVIRKQERKEKRKVRRGE